MYDQYSMDRAGTKGLGKGWNISAWDKTFLNEKAEKSMRERGEGEPGR